MAIDLMPLSTEAPRCSEFARSVGVLPPGTGLFLDRVVLVTVPLPWPKPALNHPDLKPAALSVQGSTVTTRLFASEPTHPEQPPTIEVYERDGASASLHTWVLSHAAHTAAVMATIAQTAHGALGDVGDIAGAPGATAAHVDTAAPTFLVCTQGSHDTCCGVTGVALADTIERERPDLAVRRVSHTGGHRFSPTLLYFPEGRMWAFADLALVDRIVAGHTTGNDHQTHARGWWGAKVGPAQVAEVAVRAELAAQTFDEPRIHSIVPEPGQPATSFRVESGPHTFHVEVRVGRQVPSVACEAPGGLPAKPGREFAYTIEELQP